MKVHVTKDGKRIELKDLELDHLKNIINRIERLAKEGYTRRYGRLSMDPDEIWYDEETIYGDEVKKHFHYKEYMLELKRRNNEDRNKRIELLALFFSDRKSAIDKPTLAKLKKLDEEWENWQGIYWMTKGDANVSTSAIEANRNIIKHILTSKKLFE